MSLLEVTVLVVCLFGLAALLAFVGCLLDDLWQRWRLHRLQADLDEWGRNGHVRNVRPRVERSSDDWFVEEWTEL